MTVEIRVPTLGELVTEATVAKWLKQPGERVERDEPVVELETDKVTLEVPAPQAGVIGEIQVAEGGNVPVGAVLGTIADGAAGGYPSPRPSPRDPRVKPGEGEGEHGAPASSPLAPRSGEREGPAPQARRVRGRNARPLGSGGAQARRRERGRSRDHHPDRPRRAADKGRCYRRARGSGSDAGSARRTAPPPPLRRRHPEKPARARPACA